VLKSLLKLLAFVLLCFILVEQSYRFYAAGPVAFNPVKFNRLNQLLLTDMVEASEYPDVYYQLRPNLREWFRGASLNTNSHGLPDQEYELTKPDGVFRIAIVGSSWTMATGVEPEESYHSIVEQMFADQFPDRRIEIVNFGVEMYGLREIVGTLRHRVLAWQPDMVIAAYTTYTPYLLWEDNPVRPPLPEKTNPFFQSYAARALDFKFGTGIFPLSIDERPGIGSDSELYRAQIIRSIVEIGEIVNEQGIPGMLIWLSFAPANPVLETRMMGEAGNYGLRYIPAYEYIVGKQSIMVDRQVARMDKHPSVESHTLIAQGLFRELRDSKLISGVE